MIRYKVLNYSGFDTILTASAFYTKRDVVVFWKLCALKDLFGVSHEELEHALQQSVSPGLNWRENLLAISISEDQYADGRIFKEKAITALLEYHLYSGTEENCRAKANLIFEEDW